MSAVFELFRQGGWTMFPLLLCSLAAAAIIIERLLYLRRSTIIDAQVIDAASRCDNAELAGRALAQVRRVPGPFARIIEAVLRASHLDHAQAVESMHAAGRAEMGRLQRGLTALEIIANISPLLGLLGTVLGLFTVFNAITAQGLGDPKVLSDGIAEALITTVTGLCIAIPALAFHSMLSRRAEELATEMQNRATILLLQLQQLQER